MISEGLVCVTGYHTLQTILSSFMHGSFSDAVHSRDYTASKGEMSDKQ
jgi:hypothetical protein